MGFLFNIIDSDVFQVIFKLALSSILAGVIGIERSSLNKPAGFGTHAIIGLSSSLIVIGSQYMSLYYDIDAARIPAQVLTGIGFIGAGTIIQKGSSVKGVTTAAGILSVTCIGLTVGMGYYVAAIAATIIVYIILSVNHNVSGKFERFDEIVLNVEVEGNLNKALNEIKQFFKGKDIPIQSINKVESENKKDKILKIEFSYDNKKIHKNDIISSLVGLDAIKKVEEEK